MQNLETAEIRQIAEEVIQIMKETNPKAPAAMPYLQGMTQLISVRENYGLDPGKMVVAYFLSNARTLKGERMKEIKKELNKRIK